MRKRTRKRRISKRRNKHKKNKEWTIKRTREQEKEARRKIKKETLTRLGMNNTPEPLRRGYKEDVRPRRRS